MPLIVMEVLAERWERTALRAARTRPMSAGKNPGIFSLANITVVDRIKKP